MSKRKGLLIGFLLLGLILLGFVAFEMAKSPEVVSPEVVSSEVVSSEVVSSASAIGKAKEEKQEFLVLEKEAAQFGILLRPSDVDEYKLIRDRLFANEKLAEAFKKAESEGVIVFLGREFEIGTGYVTVNAGASAEEIIEFLLGS